MSPRPRRVAAAFLAAAALLFLLPSAQAQPVGACTQADPCILVFDLDANGFVGSSDGTGGAQAATGDWVTLSIYNDDAVAHDLYLEGYDLAFSAGSYDVTDVGPFELNQAGLFALTDLTTDDWIPIHVDAPDDPASQSGATSADGDASGDADAEAGGGKNGKSDQGAPGLGVLAAVAALGAVAAFVRRR